MHFGAIVNRRFGLTLSILVKGGRRKRKRPIRMRRGRKERKKAILEINRVEVEDQFRYPRVKCKSDKWKK